ncbi:MAG: hypothetical protein H6607_08885 [Flavobacteriales bacterium]|nr:hypothetical protein [Flavobacteriales bacterium]
MKQLVNYTNFNDCPDDLVELLKRDVDISRIFANVLWLGEDFYLDLLELDKDRVEEIMLLACMIVEEFRKAPFFGLKHYNQRILILTATAAVCRLYSIGHQSKSILNQAIYEATLLSDGLPTPENLNFSEVKIKVDTVYEAIISGNGTKVVDLDNFIACTNSYGNLLVNQEEGMIKLNKFDIIVY